MFILEDNFLSLTFLNNDELLSLAIRFLLNLATVFIIVRLIYYSASRDKDYFFTYFIFNILVFFICYSMATIELNIGFGFGLFALFSILRYRTTTLGIKEMTFLFATITIGVMHALKNPHITFITLLFIDAIIVFSIFYINNVWWKTQLQHQNITYEKIELIKKDRRPELIEDLRIRTGLDIQDVEIRNINLLNDTAKIRVYYRE